MIEDHRFVLSICRRQYSSDSRKAERGQKCDARHSASYRRPSCFWRRVAEVHRNCRAVYGYYTDVRPDLRGYGAIGYGNTVNSPTTVFTTSTTNFNTITAAVGVNYLLSQTLTGSILYSFTYQSNAANLGGGAATQWSTNCNSY